MTNHSKIVLAHGDGGSVTLRFIQEEIISRFGNPSLNKLEDGSTVFFASSEIIVSTDSYIVDPPVFPGGDIGKLCISGTANDLLACGAVPEYFTFSLIISEGFPMSKLRLILDSAKQTAEAVHVVIVAGDTKVLPFQTKEGIYINTTGLGNKCLKTGSDFSVANAQEGDNVIVTGTLGDHGFAVLSAREGLGFEQRIVSDCTPLCDLIIPIIRKFESIHAMRDPTRGGLMGVLFDIAEMSSVDILIEEDNIPIQEEVRFGCEMLGIDPLHLVNEGKMVLVVSPGQTADVLAFLKGNNLGKNSAVIGRVKKSKNTVPRVILKKGNKEKLVLRQEGQPIPRLC